MTSFITIGGIWLAHHGIFRRLRYANDRVMRLNLLLLMAVSFLPFPTRLLAEAFHDPDAERAAVIFYGATLLVISLLFSALWSTIARDRELLRPEVTDQEVGEILRRATPSLAFYGGFILLALLAPRVAAIGYLVVAIGNLLQIRGDEESPAASPS